MTTYKNKYRLNKRTFRTLIDSNLATPNPTDRFFVAANYGEFGEVFGFDTLDESLAFVAHMKKVYPSVTYMLGMK